jgi:acyl-CoA thioesterase I
LRAGKRGLSNRWKTGIQYIPIRIWEAKASTDHEPQQLNFKRRLRGFLRQLRGGLSVTRVVLLAVLLAFFTVASNAAEIVALGASTTQGFGKGRHASGVSMDQAFPAQLERLLRTKGCSAEVLNAGVAGDTTGGMLARLPGLLSANTRVLILQPGSNDAAPGNNASSRSSNIADIRKYSAEHGVNVIQLHNIDRVVGDHWTGEHPDAEGQAAIAKWLFPRVLQTGVCSRGK